VSKSIVKRKAAIIANQVSVEIDELLRKHDAILYMGSDKIFVSVLRTVDSDEKITELSQIEGVAFEV
jgi:hypothetical protein